MWCFSVGQLCSTLALATALVVTSGVSLAQSKPKPAPRAAPTKTIKAGRKAKKPAPAQRTKDEKGTAEAGKPVPDSVAPSTGVGTESASEAHGPGETSVKSAGAGNGSSAEEVRAAPAAVSEKSSAEGVKTYQFGAIEVEGRLRSPQVIYFLRRVRAEFEAGALGHRSFLRELSDTRNDAAFR